MEKKKKSPIAWMCDIEMWISMATLAIVVVMNLIEIVLRAAISHSFLWIQEFSVAMMLWMTFMGFAKITYIKKDVYLDFIVNKFPEKVRDIINIIMELMIIAFLFLLTYYGIRLWIQQLPTRTIVARYPQVINTTPVILCFISLIIVHADVLVQNIRALKKSGKENN